jgi:hypothetical protein
MVKIVITGSQFDAPDKARIADAYLIKPVETSRATHVNRSEDQRKADQTAKFNIKSAISYTKAYTNTEQEPL